MFFTTINQMMTAGVDLTLVIRKTNSGLAVSVLPKSNTLKDEAQHHIVPLTVSGLPEELDAGFLNAVCRPVQKATGLITNMAQFEAQADKAAANSKAAKESKAKETKEEKEKREKYEKALKTANELIAAKKHKEALAALGQAKLHAKPQDQKSIDELIQAEKKAMSEGSLFGMMEEEDVKPKAQQPQAAQPAPQPMPQAQPVQPMQPQNPIQPHPVTARQPHTQSRQQPAYYGQPSPQPQAPRQQAQPQYRQPQQGGYAQPMNTQQPAQPQPYGMNPVPAYGQEPQPMAYETLPEEYQQYEPQPTYRPEDYEEYPDFPTSMLKDHYIQQPQIF